MSINQAFESRGTWDNDGLAWLDGRRVPEFDIIDELGRTAETEAPCDCCGELARLHEIEVRGHTDHLCAGCIEHEVGPQS